MSDAATDGKRAAGPTVAGKRMTDGNEQQKAAIIQRLDDRMKSVEERVNTYSDRLRNVEQWQSTFDALNQERREQHAKDFEALNKRLDKIQENLAKVVWLILGAIISGVAVVLFSGVANIAG